MRIGIVVMLVAGILSAQSAFEVASVKSNPTAESLRAFPRMQKGTFTAQGAPLKTLISIAYSIPELLVDGPGWLETEKYDVTAKAPDGVPDSAAGPLLQSLLRERFLLKAHLEMKEMPVFDMVVSKGGAKLKPFDPAQPVQIPRNAGQSVLTGASTTSQIAEMLFRSVGRPVLDKTGMNEQGRFGWALSYIPLSANPANATGPDIFAAIEEQLGLKLESARGTIQVLVVDSAERVPTDN